MLLRKKNRFNVIRSAIIDRNYFVYWIVGQLQQNKLLLLLFYMKTGAQKSVIIRIDFPEYRKMLETL